MGEKGRQRARTVTWEDPALSRRDAGTSGLDHLRAVRDGRTPQPPAGRLLGYRLLEVERGRTVFELEPDECHYNPFGSVHGGILSTLLDTAMTAAVLSALEAGAACATLEVKVNFVRPVTAETGALRCEGKVIHLGSRIATAEGRVSDGRGQLCAHGVTTCTVFPAR